MIRLAVRLTVGGGREAVTRLVITAVAVALGVGLLLAALAASNAIDAQALRTGWFDITGSSNIHITGSSHSAPGASPEWWLSSYDAYDQQPIERVDVAALGPHAPVPPGITRLPGPGQYYASPALAALLRSVPADRPAPRRDSAYSSVSGPSWPGSPSAGIRSLLATCGSACPRSSS
ncbi:MAG TPA: hypothetical protein VFW50_10455 [Streptosporangiaceae bacterium]|nr:hypothetical protein [Streptosporangiaceae bacterium]